MSAKENRKLQRAIRRESRQVGPGIVLLINHASFAWRFRLAWKVLRGNVHPRELMEPLEDPNARREKIIMRPHRVAASGGSTTP